MALSTAPTRKKHGNCGGIARPTALIFAVSLLFSPLSQAGVGPENVIVVVNSESTDSRTVANHYIDLRQIPSSNVVYLKNIPAGLTISLDEFKSKILKPVLNQLNARKISAQSRVIAYSAGFPTRVDVTPHHEKLTDANVKKIQIPTASITGATYFYRFMLADDPNYLSLGSNLYMRGRFERYFNNPFSGEKKDTFAKAMKELEEDKNKEAAEKLVELAKEHPTMSPLSIKAAEAYAKAGEKENAIASIRSAIGAGWWSANYLKENEHLSPLLKDPGIAKLIPLLNDSPTTNQSPVGFASNRGWDGNGNIFPIQQGGVPYMMSCSLAVIHKNGSTIKQAIKVLQRASKCDSTHPNAEFQFSGHNDVRSKTRMPGVADALVYLQNKGFKAEIFRSPLPTKKAKIVGMLVGESDLYFDNVPWEMVPGAIADNLTSYGAVFGSTSQTKLTDFLHAGAAMSSGTVTEPYAIQNKFPLPVMYGFYADGASAIEAFYMSVASPYQLLIVGDPIAQPFAKPPSDLVHIKINDGGQIDIQRESLGLKVPSSPVRYVEIFVGGQLVQVAQPAANIKINLPPKASGILDVRTVLVGFNSTEPRSSFSESLKTLGPLATPQLKMTRGRSESNTKIDFELNCTDATSIDLVHVGQVVGSITGDSGKLSIDTKLLGDGPLRFRARATIQKQSVFGEVLIENPRVQ